MDRELAQQVNTVRGFNRFYTRRIGVLDEHLTRSRFSLTEARVLYELAGGDPAPTAAHLQERLGLDPGYLSRILKGLEGEGLVARRAVPGDGRQRALALTAEGRAAFDALDRAAGDDVRAMLATMTPAERRRLVAAMTTIERALATAPSAGEPLVLREPEPGDLGWIVARHGALYAEEHGFDASFEGLVAQIVGDFAAGHDPRRERAWIAELAGEPVGSVMLVAKVTDTAKLRLLLVEPAARGRGIGGRLVDQCLRFARRAGYVRVELWTNDVLTEARRLYERAGFALAASEPHRSFGRDLVGETWTRDL